MCVQDRCFILKGSDMKMNCVLDYGVLFLYYNERNDNYNYC